jgi:integrase
MENQHVQDLASSVENVTVGASMREYLTEKEVDRLIEAAKQNRWGHRDATAILIAYRHGLRASELVTLRWSDLELQTGRLHVRRAKGGTQCALFRPGRVVHWAGCNAPASRYVFISERGAPLSVAGYQRMVPRTGEAAGFGFLVHSHMLSRVRLQACCRWAGHARNPSLSCDRACGASRLGSSQSTRTWQPSWPWPRRE